MGISSILSVLTPGGKTTPARPYIIPLNVHDNDRRLVGDKRYFQYWPEDLSVQKNINWEIKNIPGLSHPLYQWISGGSREITFTAIFTRDDAPSALEKEALRTAASTAAFSGVRPGQLFTPSGLNGGMNPFSDPRNVDIPSAVAWLESFMYPEYTIDGKTPLGFAKPQRPKPPRKLLLGLPGMRLGARADASDIDEVACIMLQADTSYLGFFEDGTPRFAKVALQFAEIIQVENQVRVQDAFAVRTQGHYGYRLAMTTRDKVR